MKVLLICPFSKPDIGGVESHLDKLTAYLCDRNEVDVTLVTYMPLTSLERPPLHQITGHLEIIRMPWFGKGWFRKLERYFPANMFYLFPGLFYKCLCVYLSRHEEFDVIHAHGLIAGCIAKLLRRLHKKRAVLSTHALYSFSQGSLKAKLFRWILKDFDHILAVGEPSRQEIMKLGIPSERVTVHSNWVAVSTYSQQTRLQARKSFGFENYGFIVLFVGRMIGIKGELILLEVARETLENITFVFVGEGPEAAVVKAEAERNSKVVYLGRLPDSQMKQIYAVADLFVSPVLYDEGFATVYLESLASGAPVITANRGCPPFFLTSQVAELLDVVDSGTVRQSIEKHFRNRALLVDKRSECRTYAEDHFTEKNADEILKHYRP